MKEAKKVLIRAYKEYSEISEESSDEISELMSDLKDHPKVNLDTLSINYASLYEIEFKVLTSLFWFIFSDYLPFDSNTKKEEVQKHFLEPKKLTNEIITPFQQDLEKENKNGDFGEEEALIVLSLFMNLIIPLFSNIRSLSLYGAGHTINDLIATARVDNDQKALFKAVQIDRCCLTTKTATHMIRRASILNDLSFFNGLAKAVKGSYPVRRLNDVRLMDALIQDWNTDTRLTYNEVATFFIKELHIYGDYGSNAVDSLTHLLKTLKRKNKKK